MEGGQVTWKGELELGRREEYYSFKRRIGGVAGMGGVGRCWSRRDRTPWGRGRRRCRMDTAKVGVGGGVGEWDVVPGASCWTHQV